ncbi:MAG: hypothetical protein IJC18_01635 [Clostridia bacterium]|nr:hypothetical protein [Clostridia bacterium]
MDNNENYQYLDITDLHFAVWNMIKPVNFIWIDFTDKCVRCGSKDEPTDTIKEDIELQEAQKEAFQELISYDEDGLPVLCFDKEPGRNDDPYTTYPADDADLLGFLGDMEEIDMLSWRTQYPSLREGLCWRIDVYFNEGEKHFSGQARFPQNWAEFGKSLDGLVKRVQAKDSPSQTDAASDSEEKTAQ